MLILRPLLLALAVAFALAPAAHAARPTDPGTGVYGLPNYTVEEEPPHCTGDVCVHWVATTDDAPPNLADGDDPGTVPDAIEILAFGLERAHDHMTGVLGWRPPVGDGTLGGGTDVTDVYVKALDGRAAGVATRDSGTPDRLRPHGYAIVDPSYLSPFLLGWAQRKLGPHEMQHLIEYAYDSWFESWNGESLAEWSAAQSDGTYDLLRQHLRGWADLTELPLQGVRDAKTHSPPGKGYAAVIWQRWLSERYGPDLIRRIWERADAVTPYSFVPFLLEEALEREGAFFDELVAFSVANAEWRTAGSGLDWGGDQPDVERVGALVPGATEPVSATLDHTTFALFDVPVAADAETYELRASAPAGTSAAVALVGRRGDAEGGTVEVALARLPEGGETRVGLADPSQFERITAVLVNADVSLLDPPKDDNGWDWRFARDDQPFSARVVRTDRPPPPVTPAESPPVVQPPADQPLPPAPGPIAEDLLPPRLRLVTVPRDALARLRSGRAVRVGLSVDEASALTAEVALGRSRTVVVRARSALGPRGRRVVVLRASRTARRRLARAAAATLVVAARDAAGNTRTVRRALRSPRR